MLLCKCYEWYEVFSGRGAVLILDKGMIGRLGNHRDRIVHERMRIFHGFLKNVHQYTEFWNLDLTHIKHWAFFLGHPACFKVWVSIFSPLLQRSWEVYRQKNVYSPGNKSHQRQRGLGPRRRLYFQASLMYRIVNGTSPIYFYKTWFLGNRTRTVKMPPLEPTQCSSSWSRLGNC